MYTNHGQRLIKQLYRHPSCSCSIRNNFFVIPRLKIPSSSSSSLSLHHLRRTYSTIHDNSIDIGGPSDEVNALINVSDLCVCVFFCFINLLVVALLFVMSLTMTIILWTSYIIIIQEYSQKLQTSVSLQTLTRTGKGELFLLLDNDDNKNQSHQRSSSSSSSSSEASHEILTQTASFIHHEMPIRLARRIKDLEKVPYLSQMPSVQAVKDIYISSFLTLVNEPNPRDNDGVREALFARKLELLYERHSSVLVQMAKGAYELRDLIRRGEITIMDHGYTNHHHHDNDNDNNNGKQLLDFEHLNECHAFLDRFYMSRIGIRVLAGQYLALRSPPMDGYIGLICQHTSPYEIVKHAVTDAYYMCEQKYGAFPKVIIQGRLDLTFAYIPTQLHYILLELLKNAMRAVVENHGVGNSNNWPPIEVIIADGHFNEDVVIKISDEGGGTSFRFVINSLLKMCLSILMLNHLYFLFCDMNLKKRYSKIRYE